MSIEVAKENNNGRSSKQSNKQVRHLLLSGKILDHDDPYRRKP